MRFSPRPLAGALAVLLALTTAHAPATAAARSTPDLFVAYPDPGARVAHDHVILEGSVTPGARLSIDGRPVEVGPDGLFMEWWPLRPGTNDLRLVSTQGAGRAAQTLRVIRPVVRALPATPTAIDRASLSPALALQYWDAPGDSPAERSVQISFRGSPGGRASYRLAGSPPRPMREGPGGTYSAVYVLPTTARLQGAAFTLSLSGRDGRTVSATAPGRLSSDGSGPRLATQKAGTVRGLALNDATNLSTDLAGEPLLYPRDGMTFTVVGRQGEDVRVRLAPGLPALVTADQLGLGAGRMEAAAGGRMTLEGVADLAPSGAGSGPAARVPALVASTPPASALPPATAPQTPAPQTSALPAPTTQEPALPELTPTDALPPGEPPAAPASPPSPEESAGDLRVRIPLGGARLPFTVSQEGAGERLALTLYGNFALPLTAPGPSSDPLLRGVEVKAQGLGVTRVVVSLTPGQAWGYHANYDGADLVLSVRRPPRLNPLRPLEGRAITLDPGHGGSQKGGAGSLRTPEKGLVLPIALRAADLLRAQGAVVRLTRTADVTLGLYERGLVAEETRSDLLVSIHANALPDGRDPRGIRGPEVYFTHPQAQGVAGAILAQLRRTLPELGPGAGLRGGAFLALTRPSAQPSLLVETAYLTDAGNLRVLHSPQGQERFAQAIAAGIADFYAAQVAAQAAARLR
ncbi:N-acetylmuramoyl-L-alanine amidase family protein [Deinococcus koreensis]|uniref:N-acetylmuramoyl-L-alanine amidase n=1 Tax=Deinococcus koreensis TaxID=2054903 RepID=A0A2K3V0W3_9DEIO|nr:N-acetylmuramoyl-L-alanine amidase [Deinococcus koreensis]PNY82416.1 N-acetylmuramoyl-L-alanine amidase [Deinococcus koreensis]